MSHLLDTVTEAIGNARMFGRTDEETARAVIAALRDLPDHVLQAAGVTNDDNGAPYNSDWYSFRLELSKLIDVALASGRRE